MESSKTVEVLDEAGLNSESAATAADSERLNYNAHTMMSSDEFKQIEFRAQLRDEFARRMRANFRYSLRAFARDLDIDSSTLSKIMSGTRAAKSAFLNSVSERLNLPVRALPTVPTDDEFSRMDADAFHVISDWYHYAIWDLTATKSFRCDTEWIAKRLSISRAEVNLAIDRLLRFQMLKMENGTLVKTGQFATNDLGLQTTAAKKEYQRQIVQKALTAIDQCPQERKDISSITISADPQKLELAREMIKHFRRQLCAAMEDGSPEDVYHLTIQLYPVTDAG